MKTITASGKTVQDAVKAGLAELQAELADVQMEVLDNGSPGLFGMFGRLAKVKLTLKEKEPDLDFDLKSLTLSDEGGSVLGEIEEKPVKKSEKKAEAPKPEKKPETPKPEKKPEAPKSEKKVEEPKTEKPAEPAPRTPRIIKAADVRSSQIPAVEKAEEPETRAEKPAREPKKEARPPREPRREPRPKTEKADFDASAFETPAAPITPAIEYPPLDLAALSETGKVAYEFLSNVTKRMGVEVEIRMVEGADHLNIQMTGDTLGILIGRRGDTLDALQYLTSLVVNKDREDYLRVTLDTENYRAKREEALVKLANRMALRVKKTGRRVALEPMNPYERRVLHSALQNNPYVTTHSEGEEPCRRVIITLK